jgi:hypothetical protein
MVKNMKIYTPSMLLNMRKSLRVCKNRESGIEDRNLKVHSIPFKLESTFHIPYFLLSLLFITCYLLPVPALSAEGALSPPNNAVWYISNAAGMALNPAPSRLVALRSEHCLAMSVIPPSTLPAYLSPYYDFTLQVDFRMLYANGKPSRQQWIFRDEKGATRLTATAVIKGTEATLAFIERYDRDGRLFEEHQFLYEDEGDSETTVTYAYEGQTLVRVETRVRTRLKMQDETGQTDQSDQSNGQKSDTPNKENAEVAATTNAAAEFVETASWTDHYQYTRSASIRSVRRVFHNGTAVKTMPRISFPPLRPHPERDNTFVRPTALFKSEFLDEALAVEAVSNIVYDVDARGRVLIETHYNEAGNIASTVKNTWAGDRLSHVAWTSFGNYDEGGENGEVLEERRIEYEYDQSGNRIFERNFNNNELERTIRKSGNQEIEELYMDGKVVLRATWEGDKKIKEERVR